VKAPIFNTLRLKQLARSSGIALNRVEAWGFFVYIFIFHEDATVEDVSWIFPFFIPSEPPVALLKGRTARSGQGRDVRSGGSEPWRAGGGRQPPRNDDGRAGGMKKDPSCW